MNLNKSIKSKVKKVSGKYVTIESKFHASIKCFDTIKKNDKNMFT